MDFPKSTPGVGLVGGQFADENPATGQIGSLIPAGWGNAVTKEILNVIQAAGIAPSESDLSQLLKAIQTITATDSKRSVVCATTGPIALSGLQTIDGVSLTGGERVLVKDQANAAQNWIYVVSAGAWQRADDANESIECVPGHLVPVQTGTKNFGTTWQFINTWQPTLGTTPLSFAQVQGRSGVTAGTYKSVTVDAYGHVINGGNPTTLAGYGITDAMAKNAGGLMTGVPVVVGATSDLTATQFISVAQNTTDKPANLGYGTGLHVHWPGGGKYAFEMLSGIATEWLGFRSVSETGQGTWREIWHSGNFDPASKATKATTLAGYGITDAYTKAEVNNALGSKADKATTLAGYGITDAYTKAEVNSALGGKADKATTLGGYGITDAYTKAEVNSALGGKADKATTLAGYGITDAYTRAVMDTALGLKFDKAGGRLTGAVTLSTAAQSETAMGFTIENPTGDWTGAALSGQYGAANLKYRISLNTLYFRNHITDFVHIDAGNITSNSQLVHTATTFIKPTADSFKLIAGATQLPANGTWVYAFTYYNGSGGATGGLTGFVAGGQVVGAAGVIGWAWRIQ